MSDTVPEASGPLADFWKFCRDFKSVTAWIAKAAVAAPLVDIVVNVGPPWPSRIAVSILVCVIEVVVLMYSFEFWRQGRARMRGIRAVLRGSTAVFSVVLILYLFLFATFVVDVPDGWNRVVIGYQMHPDVAELVASNPSEWTPKELMLQFHDEMAVWTPASVNVVRTAVLVAWLLLWSLLAVIIASFVSLQWRRQRR